MSGQVQTIFFTILIKNFQKRKVAKYNDITTASTTTEVPRTKATTTYPEFSPDFSPSFGDWLGGVAGQLPFNFSDVQPKFVVQLKSNSNGIYFDCLSGLYLLPNQRA
jgi:hypothetical protein